MSKEKQLEEVRLEIIKLQNKEEKLVEEIFESREDFESKFKFWIESGLGEILGDLFQLRNKSAVLRTYFEGMDMDRYREYDFVEFLEDEFYNLIDGFKNCSDVYTEEDKKELKKLAIAMMNNNVRGVFWDW